MKSLKVFFLSFVLLFAFGMVLAQEETVPTEEEVEKAAIEAINLDEDIQPEDLEIGEPRLLPDSPFYFLKNWARGIQNIFTFNSVRKAGLRMKFANEKLMEAKKLVELKKNPEIIEKATENYQQEVEKIKNQVEKIKERAAENPKVESFLDKFLHQQILHQKLLQKLETQVPAETFEKIKEARKEHLERFKDVMLKLEDRPEKITEKLDKILEEQKGSQFKEFKNLEVLKNLEEKVPEEAKEAIQRAQENALKRLTGDLEKMSPEDQEKFKEYLEKISGEKERQMEILENLKAKIKEAPETPKVLELRERLEEGKAKIFEKIEKGLEKLNCPLWALPAPGFCKEGRVIIEKDEKGCPLPPKCITPGEQLAGLVTCCMDSACVRVTKEKCIDAGGRIVGASSCIPNPCEKKIECQTAEDCPTPKCPGVKVKCLAEKCIIPCCPMGGMCKKDANCQPCTDCLPCIEIPKGIEIKCIEGICVPTLIPEIKPILEKPIEGIFCITLWDPVCGKDGETYSNTCFAKSAGVEIDYKGICKEGVTPIKPIELQPLEMIEKGCCTPCDGVCNLESVTGCKRATEQGICEGWKTPCPCP